MADSAIFHSQPFEALRTTTPAVLPSLLMCDFGNLENEIRRLEQAGVQALHLDIMDGHFVPNLSFGLPLVETILKVTSLTLDVHLMISNPQEYLSRYVEAGADLLSFHVETVPDAVPMLEEIHTLGAAAGLVLNPPTPVEDVLPALPHCDFVLVMSVMPGFGGQKFDPVAYDKLRTLRTEGGERLLLEVDGGVKSTNIADCVKAGADLLVAGSAITGKEDYQASFKELTALAHSAN